MQKCLGRIVLWMMLMTILSTESALCQLSFIDHNPIITREIDRITTMYPSMGYHTAVRYGDRKDVLDLAVKVDSLTSLTTIMRVNWTQILADIAAADRLGYSFDHLHTHLDTARSGWLGFLYKSPQHMWVVDEPHFFLQVDPVFNTKVGDERQSGFQFQNTRGAKIRGIIDDKVYFFTSIHENQQSFLNYQLNEINRISAIPGQGFYKPYQSSILDAAQGLDFLNTQAYVGAKLSTSIDIQLGHGRHFIGEGMRSLLLSDYAHNYFYLKLSTQVWKIHYQNLFTEMDAFSSAEITGDRLLPRKYMAAHFLNFLISDRLTIGLYEAVVFGREGGFELQYLNPIILYRSLERQLDSPDNVLLGLNYKYIPVDGWQVYGQLVVDELRTSEAFSNRGWWGNKVGWQLGLKRFDLFGVDHLDLQLEYNTVRPYTYGHRADLFGGRPVAAYAHHNQALAHPYGANFRELILSINYQATERLYTRMKVIRSTLGEEVDGSYIGRNILIDYNLRAGDFDQRTGQGEQQQITFLRLGATYELAPNYFIDLDYIRREAISDLSRLNTNYYSIGFRANVWEEDRDF